MATKPSADKQYIIRGDDTSFDLTFTDKDGNVIDITGATVFFTVKENVDDDDDDAIISVEKSTHDGVDDDPENGLTVIYLTDSETDVEIGSYFYDVQLKESDGTISSSGSGILKVLADITQRIV